MAEMLVSLSVRPLTHDLPHRVIMKLTFTWAKAVFLVSVVVSCGGAPRQVVRAALGGAGCVGFASKGEGEVAKGAVRISIEGLHN